MTNEATVAGKLDPWPPHAWVDSTGITFTGETNKGRFLVTVAADVPAGGHLFRLYSDEGGSAPRIFVVTDQKEILEQEPNDHFKKAQLIEHLPATVNGRFEKTGDVDSFAITLCAGQWLDARLDAYSLASKLDPLLRILTPDGVQVAWNHDFDSLDPRLSWRAPSNGVYVLQVMGFKYPAEADVRLAGGDGCVYRLHLQTASNAPILLGGSTHDQEPNNSCTNALHLEIPSAAQGNISGPTDEDWYALELRQDETVEVLVEAAKLGSPLDAVLKIVDGQGKELVRNEDIGQFRDPRIEWKASASGTYFAVVSSLLHVGGPEYVYRLSVRIPSPEFQATVTSDTLMLVAGETNEFKVALTRLHGFSHSLTASFDGLPEGVRAAPVVVGEKGAEVVFKLITAPDAKPAQLPVRISVKDGSDGTQKSALFKLTSSTENNGVPGGYTRLLVDSTDQLWLTLKAKAAPTESAPKP